MDFFSKSNECYHFLLNIGTKKTTLIRIALNRFRFRINSFNPSHEVTLKKELFVSRGEKGTPIKVQSDLIEQITRSFYTKPTLEKGYKSATMKKRKKNIVEQPQPQTNKLQKK